MPKEISVGAVLFHKNKEVNFLLLKYNAGHWDFIKGGIEQGETEQETLERETKEETGIKDINILPNFRERISYTYTNNREKISKEVFFYLAKTSTRKVSLSKEHTDYIWLPYKEAYKQVTFHNAKSLIKKADKYLKDEK